MLWAGVHHRCNGRADFTIRTGMSAPKVDSMTRNNKNRIKGKPGAPFGNHNAVTKHGLRASGLPPGCTYILGQVSAFRRYVRQEMGAPLSTWQEATLQSACRHETRALLAARWLRLEAKMLTIGERAKLLDTISNATDRRDKCLQSIGLDRDPVQDQLDQLYTIPAPEPAEDQQDQEGDQ